MKEIRDVTPIVRQVCALRDGLLRMRAAFPVSRTDARAKRDQQFIKQWLEIGKRPPNTP